MDSDLRTRIATSFEPLNRAAAANAFPPIAALSEGLAKYVPSKQKIGSAIAVDSTIVKSFATASVEMWQRAVHSFVISASLTDVSPLWASVSGYYSSHYSVRAAAHLLGYFQLFRLKQIVTLAWSKSGPHCTFDSKKASEKEHRFYWKTVKANSFFARNDFFTENDPGNETSDVGHRNRANYIDHFLNFPQFRPLAEAALRMRIDFISKMEFSSPPIPRPSHCPDIESVQVVAYHRLVAFRQLVDEVLGGKNRFWTVQRDPSWARDMLTYQAVVRRGAPEALGTS